MNRQPNPIILRTPLPALKSSGSVKPQRFALRRLPELPITKENQIRSEMHSLERLENKLSASKIETIQRVFKEGEKAPLKRKEELAQQTGEPKLVGLGKVAERPAPLRTVPKLAPICGPISPKKRSTVGAPSPAENEPIDYDEGLRKIKKLTQKFSNYQICELIHQKNQKNASKESGDHGQSFLRNNAASFSTPLLISKVDTTQSLAKNQRKQASAFDCPLLLRLPEGTSSKEGGQIDTTATVNPATPPFKDVIYFPFRMDSVEEVFRVGPESPTLPRIFELVNRLDIAMRVDKLGSEGLGQHESHLCFNLALSLERNGEFERVN